MSHTPGPWKVWKGHTDVYANVGQNTPGMIEGYCVAVCDPDDIESDSDGEALRVAKANARLIASAPELLEALEHLRFVTQEGWITPEDMPTDWQLGWVAACEQFKIAKVNDKAKAAIRKAKGGL